MKAWLWWILWGVGFILILGLFFRDHFLGKKEVDSPSVFEEKTKEEVKPSLENLEETKSSLESVQEKEVIQKETLSQEKSKEEKTFLYNHEAFLPLIISSPWSNYSLEEFEIWLASLNIDFSKISQDLTEDEISVDYEALNIQNKEIQSVKWNFRIPFPGEKILWNSLKIVYSAYQISFEKLWEDYLWQSGSTQKQLNLNEKNGIIYLPQQKRIFLSQDPETHEIVVIFERNENEE